VLFRVLDEELWDRVGHNPLALLRDVDQSRLDAMAEDPSFLAQLEVVAAHFEAHLDEVGWFGREVGLEDTYAYFCAEYGWHEGTATYSGGLGILAGDHTKAASELGVPLVAVVAAYLILKEQPTLLQVAGIAITLAGVHLARKQNVAPLPE